MDKRSTTLSGQMIAAAGLGALLMYLFDPQQGRRRLALARNQWSRLAHGGREMADAGLRDLAHRASGLAAEARGALRRDEPGDQVLVERVRAQMGRWISHPHAIEVSARDGCVKLCGPILKSEERRLLRGVAKVPGVHAVENQLEPHRSGENVPGLQGGASRRGPRMALLQRHWAPGPRLAALAGGSALAWYGAGRRNLPGALLALVGVGLVARAAWNRELMHIAGMAGGRHTVDIHKSIHIAAPRDAVFDLWSDVENFPHFMSFVEDVRPLDDRRSHWVVKGPAGAHVEWDARITECIRPHLLAWRSEPGSPVQHAGIVRFDDEDDGTRVSVRMSYHPPGGALGHGVAALFGRDPKQEMDADLMRMKSFIENGTPARDAAVRAPETMPGAGTPM